MALVLRPERSAAVIAMPTPLDVLPPEGDREWIPYSINAIAPRLSRIRVQEGSRVPTRSTVLPPRCLAFRRTEGAAARQTCPRGRDHLGVRWIARGRSPEPPEGSLGRGFGPSSRYRVSCRRGPRGAMEKVLPGINAAQELRVGEPGVSHRHVDERGAIDRCRVRPRRRKVSVGGTPVAPSRSVLPVFALYGRSFDRCADGPKESATVEVEINPHHWLADAPVDRVAA